MSPSKYVLVTSYIIIHPDRDTRNHVFCPYCLALRHLKAETDAERIQWSRNVRLTQGPTNIANFRK